VKRTTRPQRVSFKPGALAQARGVPSLKLQALAQAAGTRLGCDRGLERFFTHSLRRAHPYLNEPTPRPKVRFLAQR